MAEIVEALNENRPSVLDGQYAVNLVKFIEDVHLIAEKKLEIQN